MTHKIIKRYKLLKFYINKYTIIEYINIIKITLHSGDHWFN